MDKSCFCGSFPTVRVVAGNDLTVEALLSLYDRDSGVYKPLDLSDASDVSLRLVGTFSKVQGKGTAVAGSKVSALFPAGSLGVGVYGVEVTFKDSEGNGRAFERNLIGIVATSGEATTEASAEGETGEGLNITVDVKTRTVRIGGSGSGVTDYTLLENKPKINEVTLDGNKTPEDLGLMPEGGAYTKEEADGRFETKEKAASDLKAVTEAIGGKADKSDVEPYDCSWVFRLANGSEVTYEQYSELDRVVRSGRPLYAMHEQIKSSVIGVYDTQSDDYSDMVFLLYTSYRGGILCVISDRDMVNDGHYMELNTSYWELQQLLVSGASIKTVNGESVLGAGDIKTPAPTKVSELENDKNYLTEQSLKGYAKIADLAKVATSGKYEDLSGKPTILTESEVQAMINTAVVSAINTEV